MQKLIVFFVGLGLTYMVFQNFPQGTPPYISIVFAGYILLTLWVMVFGLLMMEKIIPPSPQPAALSRFQNCPPGELK